VNTGQSPPSRLELARSPAQRAPVSQPQRAVTRTATSAIKDRQPGPHTQPSAATISWEWALGLPFTGAHDGPFQRRARACRVCCVW